MDYDFKKNYIKWLNENIGQNKLMNNIYRITFPYLDRNNDHIEIYIKSENNGTYTLTDDAETLNELEFSGLNIFTSQKRVKILNTVLNSHGISIDDNHALFVNCEQKDLPLKKHMLTQCMIKVSDMFYLARPNTQSLFIEDVKSFFEQNDIYSMPDISFTGKSGLTTTYDFGIPKTKKAPERLVKVVNNLDVTKAGYITFLWGDTRDSRPTQSDLYVFIQDSIQKVSASAIKTMKEYEIKPVLWSERAHYVKDLTS